MILSGLEFKGFKSGKVKGRWIKFNDSTNDSIFDSTLES